MSDAQRIRLLLALTAPVEPCRCLLITQRGESAELRDRLFGAGGDWTAVCIDGSAGGLSSLCFPSGTFDRVVVVDIHTALADPAAPAALDREVARLLTPGGAAIVTVPWVPGGAARDRSWRDLETAILAVGLRPVARAAHSGYFAMLADAASEAGAGRAHRGEPLSAAGQSYPADIRRRMARLVVRACTFLDRVFRGRGGAPVIVALKDS